MTFYWITNGAEKANRISLAVHNEDSGSIEILGSNMEPRKAALMYKSSLKYAASLGLNPTRLKFVSPQGFDWACVSNRFWLNFLAD